MKTYELNDFEKKFVDLLEETVKVAEKTGRKFVMVGDVSKLYLGNVIGGYYPLEKALNTLKNNYIFYARNNIDGNIIKKFDSCYDYAKENSKYSLFKCGNAHPVYNSSFNPTVIVANRLTNKEQKKEFMTDIEFMREWNKYLGKEVYVVGLDYKGTQQDYFVYFNLDEAKKRYNILNDKNEYNKDYSYTLDKCIVKEDELETIENLKDSSLENENNTEEDEL